MCPVELSWDAEEPPELALLPIDTRLRGQPLAELRQKPDQWQRIALPVLDSNKLAEALAEVKRTAHVSVEDAKALGFWSDEHPEDNPPKDAGGKVEVPAWRHALINYPHPLLKRGLVVIDTPGLNAIGAEPELTLGLLPAAHASVFVLGAETGVTRSDMTIWRDHLSGRAIERFVVLNKIDTLVDPLISAEEVNAQIERQCQQVAATLEVPAERVFPLSARDALAARVANNQAGVATSRLPALEDALSAQLLPQRSAVIGRILHQGVDRLQQHVQHRLNDQRRQLTEQMLELRGLRGKSGTKVSLMIKRVEQDTADFERCTERLAALKAVHARQLRTIMLMLSSDRLRREVSHMRRQSDDSLFNLGARKAFIALCERLVDALHQADERSAEIEQMLTGSYQKLNAEYGFALTISPAPDLERFQRDLRLIQESYVRYLGAVNALRLAQPRFLEHFLRMLVSKLRVVFENASAEIEMWNKSASAQVDAQLRDRRRAFKRRRESLERVSVAEGELEQRIAEVEAQDARLQRWLERIGENAVALRVLADSPPQTESASERAPHLALVRAPVEAASGSSAA
jgi:hypothetical protein